MNIIWIEWEAIIPLFAKYSNKNDKSSGIMCLGYVIIITMIVSCYMQSWLHFTNVSCYCSSYYNNLSWDRDSCRHIPRPLSYVKLIIKPSNHHDIVLCQVFITSLCLYVTRWSALLSTKLNLGAPSVSPLKNKYVCVFKTWSINSFERQCVHNNDIFMYVWKRGCRLGTIEGKIGHDWDISSTF